MSDAGQADILGPGPGPADNMDSLDTGADNSEVLFKISLRQVKKHLFLAPPIVSI